MDKFFQRLEFQEGVEAVIAMLMIFLGFIIAVTAFRFISPLDFSARMLLGSAVVGISAAFIGSLKKKGGVR